MIANANSISIPMVDQSVHCVVTSPPYWGLRDYGLPPTEWPTVTYMPMAELAPVTVQGCDPGCAHEWGEIVKRTHEGGGNSGVPKEWQRPSRAAHTGGDSGQYCQLCGGWRGCLGLEPTPEMFVGHIVAVFREVWRVLRDDGTLWLNFGDSYSAGGGDRKNGSQGANSCVGHTSPENNPDARVKSGLPSKNLIGIPWRVAFALQADGWYLRNDIIWHKPNPMPESVTDRCTKSHEYLFLLSKSQRYYYDNEAVKEAITSELSIARSKSTPVKFGGTAKAKGTGFERQDFGNEWQHNLPSGRNRRTVWTPPECEFDQFIEWLEEMEAWEQFQDWKRQPMQPDVWTIPTRGYSGAHFATFPPALVTPCILAGTSAKGVCPDCGASWERVVEKTGPSTYEKVKQESWTQMNEHAQRMGLTPSRPASGQTRMPNGTQPHLDAAPSATTGWRPTCEHNTDPVPATILDPFCGSGTVGEVCNETGRKFIGLDLSSAYLRELALPRSENKCTMDSVMKLPIFAQGDE